MQGTKNETEKLAGVIEATNDKGVKLQGRWFNYSRFGSVPRPEVGQRVGLEVRNGFIQRLVTMASLDEPVTESEPVTEEPDPAGPTIPYVTIKDRLIIRQTCLKAAAEFGAARPDLRCAEVLKVAEVWERWVLR